MKHPRPLSRAVLLACLLSTTPSLAQSPAGVTVNAGGDVLVARMQDLLIMRQEAANQFAVGQRAVESLTLSRLEPTLHGAEVNAARDLRINQATESLQSRIVLPASERISHIDRLLVRLTEGMAAREAQAGTTGADEVVLNDPADVAHAKLQDLIRQRAEASRLHGDAAKAWRDGAERGENAATPALRKRMETALQHAAVLTHMDRRIERYAETQTKRRTLDEEAGRFIDHVSLAPAQAEVLVGGRVNLKVESAFDICPEADERSSIACFNPFAIDNIKEWSVNGVASGSAGVGQISSDGGVRATFIAPDRVPAKNPVTVTARLPASPETAQREVLVSAQVRIVDPQEFGVCMPRPPGSKPGTVAEGYGYMYCDYLAAPLSLPDVPGYGPVEISDLVIDLSEESDSASVDAPRMPAGRKPTKWHMNWCVKMSGSDGGCQGLNGYLRFSPRGAAYFEIPSEDRAWRGVATFERIVIQNFPLENWAADAPVTLVFHRNMVNVIRPGFTPPQQLTQDPKRNAVSGPLKDYLDRMNDPKRTAVSGPLQDYLDRQEALRRAEAGASDDLKRNAVSGPLMDYLAEQEALRAEWEAASMNDPKRLSSSGPIDDYLAQQEIKQKRADELAGKISDWDTREEAKPRDSALGEPAKYQQMDQSAASTSEEALQNEFRKLADQHGAGDQQARNLSRSLNDWMAETGMSGPRDPAGKR